MPLKELREKAGITQNQLADKSGLSARYISLLETNKRNPSDKAKQKLAEALNVSSVDIFLAFNRTKCSTKEEA